MLLPWSLKSDGITVMSLLWTHFLVFGLMNAAAFLTCWLDWFSTKSATHSATYLLWIFSLEYKTKKNQSNCGHYSTLIIIIGITIVISFFAITVTNMCRALFRPSPLSIFPACHLWTLNFYFFFAADADDDILVTYSLAISDAAATHDDVHDHGDGIAVFFIHSAFSLCSLCIFIIIMAKNRTHSPTWHDFCPNFSGIWMWFLQTWLLVFYSFGDFKDLNNAR